MDALYEKSELETVAHLCYHEVDKNEVIVLNEEVQRDINQEADDVSKKDKIQRQDAFYAALQSELYRFRDQFMFEDKHDLCRISLLSQMAVWVIKKESGTQIDKNIGRLFEDHNLFEFKSEDDHLTIWDYLKVIGYAYLYVLFEKVPIQAVTVSFVTKRHPGNLLNYLTEERQLTVKETMCGIYYVEGDQFKVQIIESQKLSEEENLFLKKLRKGLILPSLQSLLEAYGKPLELDVMAMVVFIFYVTNENAKISKEWLDLINQHTYESFKQIVTKSSFKEKYEAELKAQDEAQGVREIALKMLQKGLAFEEVAELVEMPLSWVKDLIK